MIDQGEQECRIGLGLYGQPLARKRASNGEMRFNLDPLHAADTGVGVASDTGDATRGIAVVAAGYDIIYPGRIGGDDKCPVPKFAVQMFGMSAFDALTGTKA